MEVLYVDTLIVLSQRTTEASTAELSPQTSSDDGNLDVVCGDTQEDEDTKNSNMTLEVN